MTNRKQLHLDPDGPLARGLCPLCRERIEHLPDHLPECSNRHSLVEGDLR